MPIMDNPDIGLNPHTFWSGALSIIAGLGLFSGRRLLKQLDGKADKETIDVQLKSIADSVGQIADRTEKYHIQNTRRLDKIVLTLNGQKKSRSRK
jgi:hypothetical protein